MGKKKLIILGSTGSIGTQTIDVVSRFDDSFEIVGLSANRNVKLLREQAKQWQPNLIAVVDKDAAKQLDVNNLAADVLTGEACLEEIVHVCDADMVVVAVSGVAGVKATFAALESGKDVALANKETLVSAGELVMKVARKYGKKIFPIDSEHSALWQCLTGEETSTVSKMILTASGGPFLGRCTKELQDVTVNDALNHPTWRMGSKISIDSATLMNKGLEVIEASVLFGMEKDNLEVVIHPQSIIHSMVEFNDGAIKAQLGIPDMRVPIQYALFHGQRQTNNLNRLNLSEIGNLTFQAPDYETFACLQLAYDALEVGGTLPGVLNMANEVAVSMFLQNKLSFNRIASVIRKTMENHSVIYHPDLDDILDAQARAFRTAVNFCHK